LAFETPGEAMLRCERPCCTRVAAARAHRHCSLRSTFPVVGFDACAVIEEYGSRRASSCAVISSEAF
jgi:hypothetical protein